MVGESDFKCVRSKVDIGFVSFIVINAHCV